MLGALSVIGSVVSHIAGASHINSLANQVPVNTAQAVEALGSRGLIGLVLGLYWGNPGFRAGINQAIAAVVPGFGGGN